LTGLAELTNGIKFKSLHHSELAAAQKNAAETLQKRGGSRVLVLAEKFEGWEKGAIGEIYPVKRSLMRK